MECPECARLQLLIKLRTCTWTEGGSNVERVMEARDDYRAHLKTHSYWWLRYPKLQSIDVWLN